MSIVTNNTVSSIQVILLDDNLLTDVPALVQTIPNLSTLTLRGNIISSPPKEVIHAGLQSILSWLKENNPITTTFHKMWSQEEPRRHRHQRTSLLSLTDPLNRSEQECNKRRRSRSRSVNKEDTSEDDEEDDVMEEVLRFIYFICLNKIKMCK